MPDVDASGQISKEDFIKRNSAIYEGIEVHNMTTTIISYDVERNVVQYQTAFDTAAGNSMRDGSSCLRYRVLWFQTRR